jgi:Family of unknown function (DUF6600)
MNRARRLGGKLGIVLYSALLGCATYGQPSVMVEVSLPGVEIRADSDFYEPLTPYGRWEVVGSYGRCWIPRGVGADWRPYCNGNWQRTDDGWYWVSDEPWGWATYHYGRWNFTDQYGWYWVPQTQWAPAWVSWHSGGGYIGWAPLYPSGVRVTSPRAYVFVEERHFLEPVRRSTVVVDNTTIIRKTVINKAPAPAVIEKASGRKVQALPVQELRHKEEAAFVARQRTPVSAGEKKVQTPVRKAAQPAAKKAVAAHETPRVEKPTAATHESAAPAPKNSTTLSGEKRKPVRAAVESQPEARHETKPEARPAAIKAPTGRKASKQPVTREGPPRPAEKAVQQPARQKPAASEKSGPNTADKGPENKSKE